MSPSAAPSGASRAWSSVAAVLFCSMLGGCQKAPTDLREWTPKDHTNTSNNSAAQSGQVNATPEPAEAPPKGLDPVTLATWGTQCASCHGRIGKGDGPNGKMLKATDLSQPSWQAQVADEQIAQSITKGKNAMPAFANLPPETVENLVWLVRWFNTDQTAVQARIERSKGTSPTDTATSPGAAPTTGSSALGTAASPGVAPTTGSSATAPRSAQLPRRKGHLVGLTVQTLRLEPAVSP